MEGKDNDLDEAENVTDGEGVEDTVDRVELFLLTRGAASTRRSSAMQRSVVLVVTQIYQFQSSMIFQFYSCSIFFTLIIAA